MKTFTCTQRGCPFEAETHPEVCPVCNNPQNVDVILATLDDELEILPWTDYTADELRDYCVSWGVGSSARSTKEQMIFLLEEAEALEAELP